MTNAVLVPAETCPAARWGRAMTLLRKAHDLHRIMYGGEEGGLTEALAEYVPTVDDLVEELGPLLDGGILEDMGELLAATYGA